MPAENDLLVRIIGDASDLQAKFELAQEQVASTASAMSESVTAANSEVAASTTESANAFAGFGAKGVAAIDSVRAAFAAAIAPAVEANAEIGGSTEAAAVEVGAASVSIREYLSNIRTAFIEAGIVAKESTVEMRESMAEAAATATESKTAMGGVLAGGLSFGGLAGIAIGVTAVTELANETAKSTNELGHLSEITGINVTKLAGLRLMTQEVGVDFEQFSNQMVKMLRAQEKTEEGAKAQTHAFEEIGLSANAIDGKSAEEALNIISGAMQKTTDHAAVVDAATTLFSRSGARAIPIFKQYGDQLSIAADEHGKLTNVTEESSEAAKEWIKNEADLINLVKSELILILPLVENAFMGIAGAIDAAALALHTLFQPIAAATAGMGGLGKAVKDGFSGNLSAVGSDLNEAVNAFENRWKQGIDNVNAHRDRVAKEFGIGLAPAEHHEGGESPAIDKNKNASKEFLKKANEEFVQLELTHKLSVAEEKEFWTNKLAEAEKGSEAYLAIEKKLAGFTQHPGGKPKHDFAMGDNAMQGVKFEGIEEKTEEKVIAAINATWKAGYEADLKEQQKNLNAKAEQIETYSFKVHQMQDQGAHAAGMGGLQLWQTQTQNAGASGQISKGQELQQLMQIHQQMAAEDDRYLQQEAAKWANEPLKKMQIDQQIAANHRKTLEQQAHDEQAILLHSQQKYQQVFSLIGTNFKTAMNGVLQGTQTMSQAFSKMFLSIELGLAEFVINYLAKKAEMWAMDKIMQLSGMAAKHTAQAVDNTATITGDAAVAAAGTMAYYSAVDPPMAPAMATLAFAETMAWASLGAFEMGGVVGGGVGQAVPIIAHAGERVLSRPQTERFEQMVSGASEGGAKTVNLHYNGQVNAFDRTGMRNTLKSHATDVVDIIREALKDGRLAR